MSLFITRFKELLENSGKMQKEICTDLGISKQKLSKWKTGYNEPNLDDVITLAKYFDVSTDYLLGPEDDFGNVSNNFSLLTNNPEDFTPDEIKLVKKYRTLQTGYQNLIKEQIQTLIDHQKASMPSENFPYNSQNGHKGKIG